MGKKKLIDNLKEASGLGDVVAAFTSAAGIEPCDACQERRAKLNAMFSFIKTAKRPLTQEEIDYITEVETSQVIKDNGKFVRLHNEIYGTHVQVCNCPGMLRDVLQRLSKQKEYDSDTKE